MARTNPAPKAVVKKPPTAIDKMDAIGIDTFCEWIAAGMSVTEMAHQAGVAVSKLSVWLRTGDERSARAREARADTARLWDEKAERGINEASDPFELARAKELAHHYRWRASKIAPVEYGDKIDVKHSGSIELASALEAARKRVREDE